MHSLASSACRLALPAALWLAGCASTGYHYSQLLGEKYHRASIDTYPVTVVLVDGKDTTRRPTLVGSLSNECRHTRMSKPPLGRRS